MIGVIWWGKIIDFMIREERYNRLLGEILRLRFSELKVFYRFLFFMVFVIF